MKKSLLLATLACLASMNMKADTSNKLYPQHFPLNEVTLGDSPLRTAMVTNIDLLLKYDVDRLLTPFIQQAGLSSTTDTSNKYYNWLTKHPSFTNWGLSDWSLEGHVGGHYLTALALAIAATENDASSKSLHGQCVEKLNYCIDILKDCQDAFNNDTEGMKGFIGGQPINFVWTGLYANKLTQFKSYGGWVPFYCEHKVLAGLRDAYVYGGNETAKELFRNMADWSVNVVSKLSTTDMQTVLGWEHGGMNEVLADAYYLFGDQKYLDGAKKYSHTTMINGMQTQSKTFLDGKHANTQVPKYIGFERIYQLDNTAATYQKAAHNFWADVTSNRTVCIGGNSVDEHFLAAANSSSYISNLNGPESCNTNNMLKLSESLFDETHQSQYADFYEEAMYNHILSTQDPETGGYVYFTSLRPQSYRIYSKVNEGMWCCVGTGMENHSKYGHFIYTTNGETLYVNLFTASTLNDEKFGIKQETQFPYEQGTKLTVTKAGTYSIAIRKPSWVVSEGFKVKVNGDDATTTMTDGYAIINKAWNEGDVISVSLPMSLRTEQCPNLSEYVAFKYGPILLGAKTTAENAEEAAATGLDTETLQNEYAGTGRMDHAPGSRAKSLSITTSPMLICSPDTVLNLVKAKDLSKLQFTISAPADADINTPSSLWSQKHISTLTLEPFANIHHARYNCYWYLQSPQDFKNSDIGKTESLASSLNDRTIDYVGTGEQQSEAGHGVSYSDGSTTGTYNNETYRDAQKGGYIQYFLVNSKHLTDSVSIMCRFNSADNGRKGTISIDGTNIETVTIVKTNLATDANGFYNMEYKIPSSLLVKSDGTPKDTLTFRLTAATTTICPGLYYVRLLKQASADDVSQGTYKFINTDWTTGDASRVAASKFSYNEDNTFTVSAGTGTNNVALMMKWQSVNYLVSGYKPYLVVRGTNLKTTSGTNYLWWLNGKNVGSQVAPYKTKTLSNGDVIIAWNLSTSGIADNCKGELYNFSQGQTIFGMTSSTGVSTIKDINFTDNVDDYITVATSISSLEASSHPSTSGKVYDIAGRQINSKEMHKGVVIENGRKVLY